MSDPNSAFSELALPARKRGDSESKSRRIDVKVKLLFPIVSATGNYSTSRFRTTKNGVQIVPRHRKNPTKHTLSVRPLKLDCQAFKYADKLYQLFQPSTKNRWRAAAKKPVKSPYDLWMQECLTNFNKGWNAPYTPSISGGYTSYKTYHDSYIPAPTTKAGRDLLDRIIKRGVDPFLFPELR